MENTDQKHGPHTATICNNYWIWSLGKRFTHTKHNSDNWTNPLGALPPVAASKDQRNAAPYQGWSEGPMIIVIVAGLVVAHCVTPLGSWERHYTFKLNRLHSPEVPRYAKVTTWSD